MQHLNGNHLGPFPSQNEPRSKRGMRPEVSVIIPTKNSDQTIEGCLRSIKAQTFGNIEMIIVDKNSNDNTTKIAEHFDAKVKTSWVGRSEARNLGLGLASGRFVLSLDSDMELEPTVVEHCVTRAHQGYDAVIIPEASYGMGFWATCKALEKECYVGDRSVEAPRFFVRHVLDDVHGYDPELEFGEDWDLTQRIRDFGYNIGRIHTLIKHNEGRLTLKDVVLSKYGYGKSLRRYRTKWPIQSSQQFRLIRPAFLRNWKKFANDPAHALGLLFMKSCEYGAAALAVPGSS